MPSFLSKGGFATAVVMLSLAGCSDSDPTTGLLSRANLTGVRFESVHQIGAALDTMVGETAETDRYTCPRPELELEDLGVVRIASGRHGQCIVGTDACIRPSLDYRVAVKVHTGYQSDKGGLKMEKAVMSVVGNLGGGTVNYHPISPSDPTPDSCKQNLLVTDFGGNRTLWKVYVKGTTPLDPTATAISEGQLARIAADGIAILREIHSHGIVHGDIKNDNFVLDDAAPHRLRVIDFGRATPYVSPSTRAHIDYRNEPVSPLWNQKILSPFELEGSPKTRRDDLFRWAECMYKLFGNLIKKLNGMDRSEIVHAKRTQTGGPIASPIFTQFHHEMAGLGFDQRPDYEKWIREFEALAAGSAPLHLS